MELLISCTFYVYDYKIQRIKRATLFDLGFNPTHWNVPSTRNKHIAKIYMFTKVLFFFIVCFLIWKVKLFLKGQRIKVARYNAGFQTGNTMFFLQKTILCTLSLLLGTTKYSLPPFRKQPKANQFFIFHIQRTVLVNVSDCFIQRGRIVPVFIRNDSISWLFLWENWMKSSVVFFHENSVLKSKNVKTLKLFPLVYCNK